MAGHGRENAQGGGGKGHRQIVCDMRDGFDLDASCDGDFIKRDARPALETRDVRVDEEGVQRVLDFLRGLVHFIGIRFGDGVLRQQQVHGR